MDIQKPLSDEELAEIRAKCARFKGGIMLSPKQVDRLLTELVKLREAKER